MSEQHTHLTIAREVVKDQDQTLDLVMYDSDGDPLTLAGASPTCLVYKGPTLLATLNVTIAGNGLSATAFLLAAHTLPASYGVDWLDVWHLRVDGVESQVAIHGHLVRRPLRPIVLDRHLTGRYPSIVDMLGGQREGFADQRVEAWEVLFRELCRLGRRPDSILNSTDLVDLHIEQTLVFVAEEFAQTGAPEWAAFLEKRETALEAQWTKLRLLLDNFDTGTIDTTVHVPPMGMLVVSGARFRGRRRS